MAAVLAKRSARTGVEQTCRGEEQGAECEEELHLFSKHVRVAVFFSKNRLAAGVVVSPSRHYISLKMNGFKMQTLDSTS